MRIQDLAEAYRAKTYDELLCLAAHPEHLTPEALSTLRAEIARRPVRDPAVSVLQDEPRVRKSKKLARWETQSKDLAGVKAFLAEVFRLYHDQPSLFIKLTAPAVIVGYLVVLGARNETREIVGHFLQSGVSSHVRQIAILEIWLISLAGYLTSWMAFCYLFAAICKAVEGLSNGTVPFLGECFSGASDRLGPFLKVSFLLFFSLLAMAAVANLLAVGVFGLFHHFHWRFTTFLIWCISWGVGAVTLLVLSRFALAVPAVILDGYPAGQAIFRSDELTERKWTFLAALLLKSLVGGYVAAVLPFWIREWAWRWVHLPYGIAVAASITAITIVEPTMFIGFALLYLKGRSVTAPVVTQGASQFANQIDLRK